MQRSPLRRGYLAGTRSTPNPQHLGLAERIEIPAASAGMTEVAGETAVGIIRQPPPSSRVRPVPWVPLPTLAPARFRRGTARLRPLW